MCKSAVIFMFILALFFQIKSVTAQEAETWPLEYEKYLKDVYRIQKENVTDVKEHTITEHGTVKMGRIGADLVGKGEIPKIVIWFEPIKEAPCNEYRWYQFVHPSLFIEVKAPEILKSPKKDYTPKGYEVETGGKIKIKFCSWRPDYDKKDVEKEEKERADYNKNKPDNKKK